jgi:hypothetical protein
MMASVTKRIRRNMMENKYGFRTSMNKIKRIQKEKEIKTLKEAEAKSIWDKLKAM